MAKKIDTKSLIHFELEKLESKVQEFQKYLENNSISKITPFSDQTSDFQDKLHKEILVQIKMQDALFSWMPILLKLRESSSDRETLETRGGTEINGLYKNRKNY